MKKLKIILPIFVLLFSATSCIVDDEVDNSWAESPYVVGFENEVANESYFEDQGVVLQNYYVNVLGGGDGTPPEQDIEVSYEVNEEASTATEGQEFNFVDNSGTLTIPAGSTFAEFPLEIITGGFSPDTPTRLILNLTGTNHDNSVVSAMHDQIAITFVGCQSDLNEYQYDVTIVDQSDNAVYEQGTETIYMDDVNVFRTETTGWFPPGIQGTDPNLAGVTFTDICGELTIPSQGLLQNQFSNQVIDEGSGPVDEDGNFVLRYSVSGGYGPFVATYTRL